MTSSGITAQEPQWNPVIVFSMTITQKRVRSATLKFDGAIMKLFGVPKMPQVETIEVRLKNIGLLFFRV